MQSLYGPGRDRHIPLTFYHPSADCTALNPCPVALLSSGYGVAHDNYSFIAHALTSTGLMVVAVQHESKGDPALAVSGNLYQARSENWQRGATTLKFVRHQLSASMPEYDFTHLLLIGHSNGGDISSWLANHNPGLVHRVVTLDNRRVPLPRNPNISVLSLRATDFPADAGVLPTEQEQREFPITVTTITQARHNAMTDAGPENLKEAIQREIIRFVSARP